jgi:cyclic pyranopterin monophosphate synthase
MALTFPMHLLSRCNRVRCYLRRSHPCPSLVRCLSEKGPKIDVEDPHVFFRDQMQELQAERELLFGFTNEETAAWKQSGSSLDPSHLDSLNNARTEFWKRENSEEVSDLDIEEKLSITSNETSISSETPRLTHISDDGSSICMVDVGNKPITQRIARAQSQVILPPEVLSALSIQANGELVGPKGLIVSTAKLAGIMAAKKTSDLIPLCHPLPLDSIQIEITLKGNIVTIECECRVTHKTGVEMEALTGASVAALTVYDMVKAVSHSVEITHTKLLTKSGGKRVVGKATHRE